MEKLKTKTFFTIFILFSLFLILFVFVFNFQNYSRETTFINEQLIRMEKLINPRNNDISIQKPQNKKEDFNLSNRLIMDYQVYTLLIDDNNNITEVINYSENSINTDIVRLGVDFINQNKTDGIYINNLYFKNYSYNYKTNKYLIILDNSIVQKRLASNLTTSLLVLFIFEIITFFVSKILSNWITKPALDSYNKQKNFIADASHELKTPLSIIMASADALESDKDEKKWLENIKSESERMSTLITSLLDLSKLENDLDRKTIYSKNNLSKIIVKSVLTFESIAFENKIKLETNVEDDIYFECNLNEISELMSILLDNAIKHSRKNSKVIINLYKVKKEINIEVINKGDEIPKEECEKIFERFYRLDKSRNRSSNRYGLGLAIAKMIVSKYNGNISAFSSGGFTTFKVILKNIS